MWGTHTGGQSTIPADEQSASKTVSIEEYRRLIPVAAQGGDVVELGDFEAGLDGWNPGEYVTLARVRDTARPGVVSNGSAVLRLDSDGALAPTITNEQRVRDADWLGHPFLTATIVPDELAGTDAPIHARLRLVHANGRTGRGARVGSRSHSGDRARPRRERGTDRRHATLTSETFSAPQGQPVRLYWDLRNVDERVRNSVVRLDVCFERADQSAADGPFGHATAAGVRGSIFVDDVTLSDSPDVVAAAKLQTHWQRLLAARGSHVETVTEVKNSSVESGRFVFEYDEVRYDFVIDADGTHHFTLGDVTYHFEDGMAAVERR
ncbi:MAG: hypothetical protein ABEI57_05345 [Halapricum sp.]